MNERINIKHSAFDMTKLAYYYNSSKLNEKIILLRNVKYPTPMIFYELKKIDE